MSRDYSQPGDPYGIISEYTAQSADQSVERAPRPSGEGLDVRGNQSVPARGIPTQAEADAIMRGE